MSTHVFSRCTKKKKKNGKLDDSVHTVITINIKYIFFVFMKLCITCIHRARKMIC